MKLNICIEYMLYLSQSFKKKIALLVASNASNNNEHKSICYKILEYLNYYSNEKKYK